MIPYRLSRVLALILAFAVGIAVRSGTAVAQAIGIVSAGGTAPSDPEPWRFNAALYAWAMSVSSTTTLRNQTLDTNASFIDILQKSQSVVGFMGYFEANKGRVGAYADLVFSKLGFGASQTGHRNPIAGLQITASANAALTYQMFIAEIGGLYEIRRWPGTDGSSTAIDGLLAFRYWNNSFAATFDATANVNFSNLQLERSFGIAVARSNVVQWVDPVLGIRLRHRFTPNQEIFLRGDIGGFGLGSQFSWQAVAAYSHAWQLTGYQVAAVLGFRALAVNYSQGSGVDAFSMNQVLYGPIIGVSFRF
jgi:hypothetical protein